MRGSLGGLLRGGGHQGWKRDGEDGDGGGTVRVPGLSTYNRPSATGPSLPLCHTVFWVTVLPEPKRRQRTVPKSHGWQEHHRTSRSPSVQEERRGRTGWGAGSGPQHPQHRAKGVTCGHKMFVGGPLWCFLKHGYKPRFENWEISHENPDVQGLHKQDLGTWRGRFPVAGWSS